MRLDPHTHRLFVLLALAATLPACGSDGDGSGSVLFVVRNTDQAVAASTPVAVSERWVAYLADEATTAGGMQLNADADTIDSVAFVVNAVSRAQRNTGVAATQLFWLDEELYLVVNEGQDEVDWNGDADTTGDLVLLHWSPDSPSDAPTFLADLPGPVPRLVRAGGDRLIFDAVLAAPPGMGLTNLRLITSDDPTTVLQVSTSSLAANGLQPRILGVDEDLVFVVLDEATDGELNADGDSTDGFVLGLLDATVDPALATVHATELCVADLDAPFRALATGGGDWLVGFLADEAQAAGPSVPAFAGYNDRALFAASWEPPQCDSASIEDIDTTDQVLFFLRYADWLSGPTANPPVNTGLVGTDRVVIVGETVGTVSLEAGDGGCDLNEDGDATDRVVRWVEATTPVLPPWDSMTEIVALADPSDVPGGTAGLAELEGRLVAVVSEANDDVDHDADGQLDFNLLAWFDPVSSASWTFDHRNDAGDPPFFAGATWMAETLSRGRLLVAAPEAIEDVNLNTFGGDTDTDDSVPVFLTFEASRLAFPFARVAVQDDNAGMTVHEGLAYYRVSESQDDRDWNQDGDKSDFVLLRTSLSTGFSTHMGDLNNLNRPAAFFPSSGPTLAGAHITQESLAGEDHNDDGDASDFLVRFFRL